VVIVRIKPFYNHIHFFCVHVIKHTLWYYYVVQVEKKNSITMLFIDLKLLYWIKRLCRDYVTALMLPFKGLKFLFF
jgi:hypothetical protein